MPLAKISFYSLIFLILFIAPQHISGMESCEQSIQKNLNMLDKQILKTAMLIKKQENTIHCTHEKHTQYLIKQKNNESSSLFSCGAIDDVISQEEINFKEASKTYEELWHKKEKLEKAFVLFQSKLERAQRSLDPSENGSYEFIYGIHKQTVANHYLETIAQELARYIREES